MAAIKKENGEWKYKVKLSEQNIKVSNPGIQQVRRYFTEEENIADVIYDEGTDMTKGCTMVDPHNVTRQKQIAADVKYADLLVPIFRKGKKVYSCPEIHEIRKDTRKNLALFHRGIKRFMYPHQYPVGLEKNLYNKRMEMTLKHRGVFA